MQDTAGRRPGRGKGGQGLLLWATLAAAVVAAAATPPAAALARANTSSRSLGAEALLTVNPIRLDAPHRARPLLVRVTAPVQGSALPVVVFSHGDGFSKDDYLPLTEYWAAHGFVVIQPTHMDSRGGDGLAPGDPARASSWRVRAEDIKGIIDALPQIERQVPSLRGRIDRSRIVVAGHSFGGHTTELLLGARVLDPAAGDPTDALSDSRVLGGVMLAPPGDGQGGEALVPAWRRSAFLTLDRSAMTRPVLVVAGRLDQSSLTTRDWTWQTDAYRLGSSPGQCLLVVAGVKHYLGGVLGLNRTEAGEAAPDAVTLVQEASLAFLQTLTDPKSGAWPRERALLAARPAPVDSLECR